jgi:hypothetical protein
MALLVVKQSSQNASQLALAMVLYPVTETTGPVIFVSFSILGQIRRGRRGGSLRGK